MKGNLTITGSSTAIGGLYDNVKIIGEGVIEGDVQCSRLKCVGNLEMEGSLRAGRMGVVGNGTWTGGVQGDALKLSGTVTVGGEARLGRISGSGTIEARGGLRCERFELKGELATGEDCEAEVFQVRGMFKIGGLLSADELNLKLYRASTAKEIGGGTINVRKASLLSPLSLFFKPAADAGLTVDVIEGDDIHLEHTKAEIVRGNRVTIGAGCAIGLVEYKGSLTRSKDAVIRAYRKV